MTFGFEVTEGLAASGIITLLEEGKVAESYWQSEYITGPTVCAWLGVIAVVSTLFFSKA